MQRSFAVLAVMALCAGLCGIRPVSAQMIGGSPPLGQPQITIKNTSVATVKSALRSRMDEMIKLNAKTTLGVEETSNTLKFTAQSKVPTGAGGALMPMGQMGFQLIFEITAVGKDVLIVSDSNVISRPGEHSEKVVRGAFDLTPRIRGLLEQLQRDVKPSGAEKTYKEMNAWFGAFVMSDSAAEAGGKACPKSRDHKGMCIVVVPSDSPAFAAGLRMKDVLISFNGMPVRSIDEYTAALASARIGQSVPVVYVRDGQAKTVTSTLGPRPKEIPRF